MTQLTFSLKGNKNYCATIIEIDNIHNLDKCDNINGTNIFNNHYIIPNNVKIGDIGIIFPIETTIDDVFLSKNNLFNNADLNIDINKKGFFEKNGRVKCLKLRGHKSEGFYIDLQSFCKTYNIDSNIILNNKDFYLNLDFDYINDQKVCEKYIVPTKIYLQNNSKQNKNKYESSLKFKLIEDQFRFHCDTEHLGKNYFKLNLSDIISITEKLHGTSFVVSKILCNKKLTFKDKIFKFLGANINNKEYDNIYASRKVIKNIMNNNSNSFYDENIWKTINDELNDYLIDGMSIYGECVGFTSTNSAIQKKYDYSCKNGEHKNYIYRITTTNPSGIVNEWSFLQIIEFCKKYNLLYVPLHYYGSIEDFINKYEKLVNMDEYNKLCNISYENDINMFIYLLNKLYLDKKCNMCINNVPNEGVVVRKENSLQIELYKHKSFQFKILESKSLDSMEINIEDNQ